MAKRYFAYVLFALGFVTVTFFRNYAGQNIPYPFVFWIAGALMYGYGLKLLYWTPNFREQKALNIRKNEIDDLITKGDKITVDLDTCEIKENNYIFEKDKRRGRYNSTEDNDLSFEMKIRINSTKSLTNSFDNVDQYQINQSVVVFKMNMNADEKTFYSEVLPYERETLMFLLDTQKETILYIDKNDTSKYYMDMGFLSNHK